MHDELRQGDVELGVAESRGAGRRPFDGDARVALARRLDEGLGGVDRGDRGGSQFATGSAPQRPGPQPTSSARWPCRTSARSASSGESGVE